MTAENETYNVPGLGSLALGEVLQLNPSTEPSPYYMLSLNGVGLGLGACDKGTARNLLYRYVARSLLERHARLTDELMDLTATLGELGDDVWNLGTFRQRIQRP